MQTLQCMCACVRACAYVCVITCAICRDSVLWSVCVQVAWLQELLYLGESHGVNSLVDVVSEEAYKYHAISDQIREYKEKKKREFFHIDPSDPELQHITENTTDRDR